VDVYFNFIYLKALKGMQITYMDIGAHHPMEINNTYFFYREGFHGVLVEPNDHYCKMLRQARPRDVTLEAGIGVSDAKEADYYLMNASALNTFSKQEAERIEKETGGKYKIEEVRTIPLLNVNEVMEEHFQGAPAFVSIDTEGLDLEILKTIDFQKYRPKVFCVETLVTNSTRERPEIAEFMKERGYAARGGSIVNTIFLDEELLTY
jgi:FkbM family methyltransferase